MRVRGSLVNFVERWYTFNFSAEHKSKWYGAPKSGSHKPEGASPLDQGLRAIAFTDIDYGRRLQIIAEHPDTILTVQATKCSPHRER